MIPTPSFNGLPVLPRGIFWYVKDYTRDTRKLRLGRLTLVWASKVTVSIQIVHGSVSQNSFTGGKFVAGTSIHRKSHRAVRRAARRLYRKYYHPDGREKLIWSNEKERLSFTDPYDPIKIFKAKVAEQGDAD